MAEEKKLETQTEKVETKVESKVDPIVESIDVADLDKMKDHKIPYSRFKEVNQKARETEAQLKALQSQLDQKVQSELDKRMAEYKSSISQREDNGYLDLGGEDKSVKELKDQIASLRSELGNVKNIANETVLKSEMKELMAVYPNADEKYALAIKKIKPDWTLEQCVEYSHTALSEKVDSQLKSIIEAKKEASKRKVQTSNESIINYDGPKPKTNKEAHDIVRKYFGG